MIQKLVIMRKNLIIHINGQLGGTLFRQEARQQAEKLSLMGIARIQSNGELRIEAEGEEDALDAFVKWCKTGPEGTEVQRVDVQDGQLQDYDRFMEMR